MRGLFEHKPSCLLARVELLSLCHILCPIVSLPLAPQEVCLLHSLLGAKAGRVHYGGGMEMGSGRRDAEGGGVMCQQGGHLKAREGKGWGAGGSVRLQQASMALLGSLPMAVAPSPAKIAKNTSGLFSNKILLLFVYLLSLYWLNLILQLCLIYLRFVVNHKPSCFLALAWLTLFKDKCYFWQSSCIKVDCIFSALCCSPNTKIACWQPVLSLC